MESITYFSYLVLHYSRGDVRYPGGEDGRIALLDICVLFDVFAIHPLPGVHLHATDSRVVVHLRGAGTGLPRSVKLGHLSMLGMPEVIKDKRQQLLTLIT